MFRQTLERELSAATTIALKLGLGPVVPELLHLGNHTTARLNPWPIVARIASGTSFDLGGNEVRRELAVALHLAKVRAPSVRPASDISAGPFFESGCAITLWNLVEGRPVVTPNEQRLAAAALQQFHAGLRDIPLELPSFLAKIDSCETILASGEEAPQLSSDDRLFLQKLYRRLREDLSSVSENPQPLHGDAHVGNSMIVGSGAIWMDLESVCTGPLEWDVAFLPPETWSHFTGIDEPLLDLLSAVRSCCVATWCWAEFGRSEGTGDAAIYHLGKLKSDFG